MKIHNIVELLKTNKLLAILTPNKIEAKLLYDRFRFSNLENIKIIDNCTLEINNSKLMFITPDKVSSTNASYFIIEFPDSIPFYIFNRFPAFAEISLVNVEIL
jgi:hydroxymethylpyrimidine/phosphomethylpyrimidine kinase